MYKNSFINHSTTNKVETRVEIKFDAELGHDEIIDVLKHMLNDIEPFSIMRQNDCYICNVNQDFIKEHFGNDTKARVKNMIAFLNAASSLLNPVDNSDDYPIAGFVDSMLYFLDGYREIPLLSFCDIKHEVENEVILGEVEAV